MLGSQSSGLKKNVKKKKKWKKHPGRRLRAGGNRKKKKKAFSQQNLNVIKKAQDAQRKEGQPGLGGDAADLPGTSPFLGCQQGLLGITKKKTKKEELKLLKK